MRLIFQIVAAIIGAAGVISGNAHDAQPWLAASFVIGAMGFIRQDARFK